MISKDKLSEPFNLITEFEIKSIPSFENYYKDINQKIEILNQLDFDPDFKQILDYAKALSSDTRLKIVYFIHKVNKTCFCELKHVFNIKQSTLNYHLGLLKRANLVKTYKEGKLIVIELNNDFQKLLPKHFKLFDSN